MPLTRNLLYFDAQIGAITRTAPFQTLLGVGSCQTATMRRQLCWLHRAPGDWRDADPLLGLLVLRHFPASSGPLGGIEALLESSFESQGDIYWEEPTSQRSRSSRGSIENICLSPSREINILESLFICLIYRLLEGSNELSTHGQFGFFSCLTIG